MTISPNIEIGPYCEAEFTKPRQDCPNPERWSTWDIQGTEREVIDMIAGMVRGLQPNTVLETGTSRGFMALAIAESLSDNGQGQIISYEPDFVVWNEAVNRLASSGVASHTYELLNEPSMSPWSGNAIDFAWFDSLIGLRVKEYEFYSQWFHSRTIIGFHDTAPHFGGWSAALERRDDFDMLRLPTPRGVIIGRWVPPY